MNTLAQQAQPPTATVLVVDDESTLRETVGYNLRREGYGVVLAADGQEALDLARSRRPDVIVLDIMLPVLDGFQVCRVLRAESTVPILLLSARGEEIDRVLGLEIGADDYLTKPFAMRELVARVRAMLRRAEMSPVASKEPKGAESQPTTFDFGDLRIDVPRHRVILAGSPLGLKPKEFDLLAYLARHPGVVLSREALLREVWGYDFPMTTRTVDVHIFGIRQKLEIDPAAPRWIGTVRGYGYRFVVPRE